ncbi:protein Njmu-R1-like [Actinia tenebrosa]|uniref:Protein Njmu-R1-like n=1 Tax=Actinia tenebrosa TaxID=6105 RepID=A0A6P8I611_ACTTE|nr:protein Njmu-R1-like [Actinia tenebrosa]
MAEEETKYFPAELREKEKELLFRGYALYTYNANRPSSAELTDKTSSGTNEEGGEGSVADFLRKEATANHDFSLSLLSTNLTGEQDTELRTFIAKRLAKGTVYSGSGNVATIEDVLPNTTSQCYYCLLRGDKEDEDNDDSVMSLGRYLSKDFVVCFVADAKTKLELFQKELDDYSSMLLPELMTPIESLDVKEQFGHLNNWYEENVEFLCRCVSLLKEDLSVLIQCGLVGMNLQVKSSDSKLAKDAKMFVNACSTMNTLNLQAGKNQIEGKSLEEKSFLPTSLNLTIDDEKRCELSTKEATSFCKEWAKTMLSGDTNDPMFLREVIENYKLRVNHDLNTLKRLFRQAETDHYALYRSYQFLLKCGNGPVLLHNTKQEADAMSSEETSDILKVLEDYIKNNNKFVTTEGS